jgi:chloramphenicol-sensitive protein RarD
MKIDLIDEQQARIGNWFGVAAYSIWGILPLYWKLLHNVPALEVLLHRILWSFIFICIAVTVMGNWNKVLQVASNRKKMVMIFTCGFLVSINWYIYIYAVNSGQVIEASMGYFINPLVVVLLSVTVLKEKLGRWQLVAIILAAFGVLTMALQYGRIPWIALLLAATFALYGLIKKIISIEPVAGLVLETLIVMPLALFFIMRLEITGSGSFLVNHGYSSLLLVGTGIATLIPLLLYATGIQKTTFSMMGFLQYIAPSINLFLGIFVFREYFSLPYLISFCFIWAGLAVFTLANVGFLKDKIQVQVGK